MKNYLIVGGNAVLGQGAITAIRNHDKQTNEQSYIIGTSSSDKLVENADKTITNLDLLDKKIVEQKAEAINKKIDVIIYIPARGWVGASYKDITKEQVVEALEFCIDPCMILYKKLKPSLAVGISAFVWSPQFSHVYGAMIYAKHMQDIIAARNPNNYKSIRFGFFESFSSRGISILIHKNSRTADTNSVMGKMYQEYLKEGKPKGIKYNDYFMNVFVREEQDLGKEQNFTTPYRMTTKEDIVKAFEFSLFESKKPIVNVIGQWVWEDTKEHPMPELVEKTNFSLQDKYIQGFS